MTGSGSWKRFLCLALLILGQVANRASAQTSLKGRILDPGGQPLQGVEVLLHSSGPRPGGGVRLKAPTGAF